MTDLPSTNSATVCTCVGGCSDWGRISEVWVCVVCVVCCMCSEASYKCGWIYGSGVRKPLMVWVAVGSVVLRNYSKPSLSRPTMGPIINGPFRVVLSSGSYNIITVDRLGPK